MRRFKSSTDKFLCLLAFIWVKKSSERIESSGRSLLPSQLAMAIGTALPDAPSDIISAKRTSAVLFGNATASRLMVTLYAITYLFSVIQLGFDASLISLLITGVFTLMWGAMVIMTFFKITVPGSKEMVVLTGLSIFTNTLLVLATALVWL